METITVSQLREKAKTGAELLVGLLSGHVEKFPGSIYPETLDPANVEARTKLEEELVGVMARLWIVLPD